MRYTNWAAVVARYPSAAKIGGAEDTAIEAAHIYGAEAEVDARLAARYAVPFASTPTLAPHIIKDVSTDLVYYRIAGWTLKPEQSKTLWDYITSRLEALAAGSMSIVTSAGLLAPSSTSEAWGTHAGFTNITGMDDVENWAVSDTETDAEADRRL